MARGIKCPVGTVWKMREKRETQTQNLVEVERTNKSV